MGKTLIAYYSRRGENYWNGSIKNITKGNTERIAEMIADITGGDPSQTTLEPWERFCSAMQEVGRKVT